MRKLVGTSLECAWCWIIGTAGISESWRRHSGSGSGLCQGWCRVGSHDRGDASSKNGRLEWPCALQRALGKYLDLYDVAFLFLCCQWRGHGPHLPPSEELPSCVDHMGAERAHVLWEIWARWSWARWSSVRKLTACVRCTELQRSLAARPVGAQSAPLCAASLSSIVSRGYSRGVATIRAFVGQAEAREHCGWEGDVAMRELTGEAAE